MKRILLTLATIAAGLSLSAQTGSDLLKKIADAPLRSETVISKFSEVRTPSPMMANAKTVTLTGDLTYKNTTFLSMIYDNGEMFAINGNSMVINRDGHNQVFDTSKNLMMQGLSHALIYTFEGKLSDLAQEQNADIKAEKKGNEIVVTLTARQKSARGYSTIVVSYDAKTYAIRSMRMDEFTGASSYYTMK